MMLAALIRRMLRGHAARDVSAASARDPVPVRGEDAFAVRWERAKRNFAAGDYATARLDCERLIELDARQPRAWLQLGRTLNKQRDHAAAIKALDTAIVLDPDDAAAYFERGIAHERMRRFKAALADYEFVSDLKRESAAALINRGRMHYELGDFEQALACTERALAIEPDHVIACQNAGLRLRDLGRLEQAAQMLRRAVDLRDANTEAMAYLALVLIEAGRLEEAQSWVTQALALEPDYHDAHWAQALIFLLRGDFGRGWQHYESRRFRHDVLPRPYRHPEWDGTSMPHGTLLVYAEQGLGDDIIFASCLPDVMRLAGRVVIECDRRLAKLFGRSFPGAVVHGSKMEAEPQWPAQAGEVSAQIAAGSLPRLLRRAWEDFPQHCGYLKADPVRVEYWNSRMAGLGSGVRVGLAWTGGSLKTRRRLRSVTVEDMLPLLKVAGAHFISLQYTDSADEVSRLREQYGLAVHHWPEAIEDYDETAALVSALDVVISVQTAVVHLSGALGQRTWVLVPSSPEWRYLQSGERMPWYPSVRLLRQSRGENWAPVIEKAAAELARLSGAATGASGG